MGGGCGQPAWCPAPQLHSCPPCDLVGKKHDTTGYLVWTTTVNMAASPLLPGPEPEDVLDVTKLASRLLYPNPVCLLGTCNPSADTMPNIMTISWLTCVNNDGLVFLSMNERRSSAAAILATRSLCLSVAVTGMQKMLVQAGSCHGPQEGTSKPEHLGIDICQPGWTGAWSWTHDDEAGKTAAGADATTSSTSTPSPLPLRIRPPAVVCAGAHLLLQVESVTTQAGHHCIMARVEAAWVRKALWAGRTYKVPSEASSVSILTFLGSGRFATVVTADTSVRPDLAKRATAMPTPATTATSGDSSSAAAASRTA